VTLAADYAKEQGRPVDPRTIAADIAAMRRELKAPIAYDYQNRGYRYTNDAFQLSVLAEEHADIPLSNIVPEAFPKTAFIPEWQQRLLSVVMGRAFQAEAAQNPFAGKVSVLPPAREAGGSQETVLEALKESRALAVRYAAFDAEPADMVFLPLHLICVADARLVLGRVRAEKRDRYALLRLDRIQGADALGERFAPPSFAYAQTTNNSDIEVILSGEDSDVFLVFTAKDAPSGQDASAPEYRLLAQTEIFL
jgi:predicted DNA-binding transcriptional regulator YafY